MFIGVYRGIIKRDSQERRPIGQRLAAIITQFNLILQIFDVIPIQNATETHWSTELAQAIKSPAELMPLLGLSSTSLPQAEQAMAAMQAEVERLKEEAEREKERLRKLRGDPAPRAITGPEIKFPVTPSGKKLPKLTKPRRLMMGWSRPPRHRWEACSVIS